MQDWELEDVECAAAQSPTKFFIASREERESQQPGSAVRLHFILKNRTDDSPRAERMWVEIKERLPNGDFSGYLKNVPGFLKSIKQGDELVFSVRHIARILMNKSNPHWIECGEKNAFISKMAFEEGEVIRFAYRVDAVNSDDSGWSLFTGHESQEYNDNPDNIRHFNVYWLAVMDSTLAAIFRSPIGSVFARDGKESEWNQVTDWKPPDD